MGLGLEAKNLYEELASDPAFAKGNTVCELGSQDISPLWGETSYADARDLYKALGMSYYCCIDIDGRHESLRLDLNTASQSEVGSTFDLVTNHGTTEHCFNQHNCFKLMHDLTKVGGLMLHIVPSHPWNCQDDSFYYYSRQLFVDIAEANEYEIVKCAYIDGWHGKMVAAALRRKTAAAFCSPIQKMYQLPKEGLVLVPPTTMIGIRNE